MNYYYLKKNYFSDIQLVKEKFNDKILDLLSRRQSSQRNHFWDPVTEEILSLQNDLEILQDLKKIGMSVHHVNMFVCKENRVGGLHIDNARDPRNCSLNLPISGCEGSKMIWVDPDQFFIKETDLRDGPRAGLPSGHATDPKDWNIIETIDAGPVTLFKTNTWHSIDNRGNPNPRIALAFRLALNPKLETVIDKLKKNGL